MQQIDLTQTLEELEGEYWDEHRELKNELDEFIRIYEEATKILEKQISKYRSDPSSLREDKHV